MRRMEEEELEKILAGRREGARLDLSDLEFRNLDLK